MACAALSLSVLKCTNTSQPYKKRQSSPSTSLLKGQTQISFQLGSATTGAGVGVGGSGGSGQAHEGTPYGEDEDEGIPVVQHTNLDSEEEMVCNLSVFRLLSCDSLLESCMILCLLWNLHDCFFPILLAFKTPLFGSPKPK